MDDVFAAHLRDLSDKADRTGRYSFTDFLNLDEQNTLSVIKRELIPYSLFGGAEGCERVIARFGDTAERGYEEAYPIACVKISPLQQKFADELTHRDILGALMHLGIERSCLGDIILRNNEAYLFTLTRIAPYICDSLSTVKHTSVSCEITETLPDGALFRKETVRLNVTSLRVDCVVASAYNLSRGAAEKLFDAQKVFIDGKMLLSGATVLKEGNVVSVRGYGRFIYRKVEGTSKKGRLFIFIEKYV